MNTEIKIPCKYYEHWRENQSPLGSGECWPMDMEDCNHPGFDNVQRQMELETYEACNENCPGYKPIETKVCPKHGLFIAKYGCESCQAEEMKEIWESI